MTSVHHPDACASYWFPKLRDSGARVPTTVLIHAPDLTPLLDGERVDGADEFFAAMEAAASQFGWPCFIRTGRFSGKHSWNRTCFVPRPQDLKSHIGALVEESHLVDFLGLETDVWLVREYLAPPDGAFTAFRGMPVRREFRVFLDNGSVHSTHPYWPEDAMRNPSVEDWRERLQKQNRLSPGEVPEFNRLSTDVAQAFEGRWSLDWMEHDGQWWAIDMAPAECSWGNPWAAQPMTGLRA